MKKRVVLVSLMVSLSLLVSLLPIPAVAQPVLAVDPPVADPQLVWNTFLGGSGYDGGGRLALDGDGNVYVAGYSDANWGSPLNAHSGGDDVLVAKLDNSGMLQWHTFLGSSGNDIAYFSTLDENGNIFVKRQRRQA